MNHRLCFLPLLAWQGSNLNSLLKLCSGITVTRPRNHHDSSAVYGTDVPLSQYSSCRGWHAIQFPSASPTEVPTSRCPAACKLSSRPRKGNSACASPRLQEQSDGGQAHLIPEHTLPATTFSVISRAAAELQTELAGPSNSCLDKVCPDLLTAWLVYVSAYT